MLVLIAALRSEVMEDLDKVVKSLEDDSWKFTQPQSKPYFFYRSGMLLLFFYFSNQHWFWCRTAGCYCLVPTGVCYLAYFCTRPGQARPVVGFCFITVTVAFVNQSNLIELSYIQKYLPFFYAGK